MNAPVGEGVTAVVPLRDGVSGKSRLAAVLDDAARRALVTVLAQHVVGTLLATPRVGRVVVVTADTTFARSALGELSDVGDLVFLAQPSDRPGLNAALDVARESLPEPGVGRSVPGRLLISHADLPALTPADVTALIGRSDPAAEVPAEVVVATDRVGRGTNLLMLGRDAGRFRFRFGADSRAAHEAEGSRLGLRVQTVDRPGTAVDLDTVEDWNELPAAVRDAVARYAPFPPGP